MSEIFVNSTTLPAEHVLVGRRFQMAERGIGPGGTSDWVWSALSPETVAPALTVAPSLTATAASSSQIDVTRTAVTGATSYELEVSPNGTDSWVALTLAMPATYNLTGLAGSTTRYFRARARNSNPTAGPYSAVVSATTAAATETVILADTFTSANGSLWDSTKWEVPVGEATYTIEAEQAQIAMPATAAYGQHRRSVKIGVLTVDDFQIEWDWIPQVVTSHDVGFMFRINDTASFFYEVRVSASSSTGRTRLFKAEGAGAVEVHAYTGGTAFVAGTVYRNRLKINAGRIRYQRWIVGNAESVHLIDWTDTGTVITGSAQRGVRITAANVGDSVARATRFDNVRLLGAAA